MDSSNPEPYGSYFASDTEYVLLMLTIFIFGTLLFAVIKAASHSLKRFRSYYEESEISESNSASLALKISDNYKVYSYAEHIASTIIYTFLAFLKYSITFNFNNSFSLFISLWFKRLS